MLKPSTYESLISFTPAPKHLWPNVSDAEWNDSKWQLKNRINSLAALEDKMHLTSEERAGVRLAGNKLAMSVTPQFFSIIDTENPHCPIRRQVIPRMEEAWTAPEELSDPCGEDKHMPVPGLVHRYPDRVLFLVTDRCASYCRYCTRSRVVSGVGDQHLEIQWEAVFQYLERTPQVRDVLLSGGDPLLLSDERLERILSRLHAIPHIQFIRIGSRIPIFLPQRITPSLCEMLRKFHPLFISIHTNHPHEITTEVQAALNRLADAGIPMGNQSVLLKGVNDNPEVMRALIHKLLMCRVRPYYLYQCDLIQGSTHLRTPLGRGIEIMEQLRGHTTGYGIPQYVIDGPNGGGKIPLNPEYIVSQQHGRVILRNYKKEIYEYPDPSPIPPQVLEALHEQTTSVI